MTRRERLMATLAGKPVDRPPVSFYELNGIDEQPEDLDPFNIFSDPSWLPLIKLTRDKSDRIVMRKIPFVDAPLNPVDELTTVDTQYDKAGSRFTTRTIIAGSRSLSTRSRQDTDVNTVWTLEHLLKDTDDLRAWLDLPEPDDVGSPDVSSFLKAENALGDAGIVLVDIADPLCCAADLFEMGQYTIIALTEPELFHCTLEKFARIIQRKTEMIAEALPGRLWRIYGPEYACPPYLPPDLYSEYVVKYDAPLVNAIKQTGGYARIHSHGNSKDVLPRMMEMNPDGLDPIEPPPQGDVELIDVRKQYGHQLVLFGNLEISDIETLPTAEFELKVRKAIKEGTAGSGRGFVLMPSACPYGRHLPEQTLRNYELIIKIIEEL